MCKEFRVDGFVCGNHTKKYFNNREAAEQFGIQLNQRGEIVFLLKRMNGTNLYDLLKIIQ